MCVNFLYLSSRFFNFCPDWVCSFFRCQFTSCIFFLKIYIKCWILSLVRIEERFTHNSNLMRRRVQRNKCPYRRSASCLFACSNMSDKILLYIFHASAPYSDIKSKLFILGKRKWNRPTFDTCHYSQPRLVRLKKYAEILKWIRISD